MLANTAEQDVPCRDRVGYEMQVEGDRLQLRENGAWLASVATPDEALAVLDDRLRRRVFDYLARAGWLLLDAGLAATEGRRFLTVGGTGGSRAALLVRMLGGGDLVEGADVVIARGGEAVGVPLPLRVEGSSVEPAALGLEWRLSRAPVSALVVLDRQAPSVAAVEPLTGAAATEAVLRARVPAPALGRSAAVREAVLLLRDVETYRVRIDDITTAAVLVREALGRPTRRTHG